MITNTLLKKQKNIFIFLFILLPCRFRRGLVGAGRAHVRDAGREVSLRRGGQRREPRPEHRRLSLPK